MAPIRRYELGTVDFSGDRYTVEQTGQDENFRPEYEASDADDGSLLAEIDSRGALVTAGRKFLPGGQWIAHEYEITDPEGDLAGTIAGGFAIFDQYDVEIDDPGSVPTDPIVIATVVIDAIQGN